MTRTADSSLFAACLRSVLVRRAAWACLAVLTCGVGAFAGTAWASAVDDSKTQAAKGAALFKKADYLGAAQAFEKAFALDARDFRVLRYAGRSWQEVGHWERALNLLERYQSLETDDALKASVQPNIDLLRKATPRERAERLEKAVQTYPQARLEEEAAAALEGLDDTDAFKRAIQLYEVARLGAVSASDKARLDKEIKRVRDLAKNAEARKAEVKTAAAKPTEPAVPLAGAATGTAAATTPSTLQWLAWGGGAAVAVAGAALWALGASQSQAAADAMTQANNLPSTDPLRPDKVKTARRDYDGAGTLYHVGMGLTVAGALGAAAGFFLSPDSKVAVAPAADGVALAVRF